MNIKAHSPGVTGNRMSHQSPQLAFFGVIRPYLSHTYLTCFEPLIPYQPMPHQYIIHHMLRPIDTITAQSQQIPCKHPVLSHVYAKYGRPYGQVYLTLALYPGTFPTIICLGAGLYFALALHPDIFPMIIRLGTRRYFAFRALAKS